MGEQGSESALSRGLKKAPATTVNEQAFLGGREVPPAIPIPAADPKSSESADGKVEEPYVALNPDLAAVIAASEKKMGQRMFHTRLDDDLFNALQHLKKRGADKVYVVNQALRAYLNIPSPE
jgi:hypothetical protein